MRDWLYITTLYALALLVATGCSPLRLVTYETARKEQYVASKLCFKTNYGQEVRVGEGVPCPDQFELEEEWQNLLYRLGATEQQDAANGTTLLVVRDIAHPHLDGDTVVGLYDAYLFDNATLIWVKYRHPSRQLGTWGHEMCHHMMAYNGYDNSHHYNLQHNPFLLYSPNYVALSSWDEWFYNGVCKDVGVIERALKYPITTRNPRTNKPRKGKRP